MISCISAVFPVRIGCSQWPTSQCAMNCLTQTVVLFSALSTDGWRGRGAGGYTNRLLWLDARFSFALPLALRTVTLDMLSPLPAPFSVHAQDEQARNRLETVWSVSEIDKIGDGVLHLFAHLQGSRLLEMGISSSPLETSSPMSRYAQPK